LTDAGSATAGELGLTGSTRSDGAADTGRVDLGFHYGASPEQSVTFRHPVMPLYVRADGRDDGDGLTPATALATITAAAERARAGVTVVVGPGTYGECDIQAPASSGQVSFHADPSGTRTGDPAGRTLVDASRCGVDGGTYGFTVDASCGVAVEGFHVRGAREDGIRVRGASDGARIQHNVAFANGRRGINVVNSHDVSVRNNLVRDNGGGIQVGSGARDAAECPDNASLRAVVEHNTALGNAFNGILVGAGICPSTDATVRYNITAENGRDSGAAGLEIGNDATRAANLIGYRGVYNLAADRFADGLPRGEGERTLDLAYEALFAAPEELTDQGDWRLDRSARLAQRTAGQGRDSPAVDYADVTATRAGMGGRSTRTDGAADAGVLDLGYHYPSGAGVVRGDCDGDGRVAVSEIVLAVSIALGIAPLEACEAASGDGVQVAIADLVAAVQVALSGSE
jgi:parallel beta-helix repeat protein